VAPSTRRRLERAEDVLLRPEAVRSAGATRRLPLEDAGRRFDYRTAFQRDRDRILYSRAFRRLRQKAQSGVLPAEEDHRRNRLTHTLEVAQIARTLARALRLNEDLAEAVALAHDLGQPPFGPPGEAALDAALSGALDGRGGPGLGDLGGFRRTWQGLRVVDRLEKRYAHPGLNLTDAVREGIVKSDGAENGMDWLQALPPGEGEGIPAGPPSLEAQAVALADRLVSALEELDDAVQGGRLELPAVERLPLVRELRRKLGAGYPQGGTFVRANAIHRGLTHLLVTAAILGSEAALDRLDKRRAPRAEVHRARAVALPSSASGLLADLEGFLAARARRGAGADREDRRARHVLLGLLAAFVADPWIVDDHVLFRFKEIAGVRYLRDLPRDAAEAQVTRTYRRDGRFVRLLGDHVAAMTEAFALAEHRRLMEMGAVPIPSAEQLRREEMP
jgi:dGTPase